MQFFRKQLFFLKLQMVMKPFLGFFFSSLAHYISLYSHVSCKLLFMSTIHHNRPCVTSSLCPVIDVAGFYLTNWCTRRTWEEKVLMQQQQQSRGILLITRSANLIFQLRLGRERKQRGGSGGVGGVGGLTAEGGGGLGGTGKTKKGPRTMKHAGSLSLPLPPSTTLTSWSHRERSRAWRCRWRCWSSASLFVVSSSAPPGSAGEHWRHRECSRVTVSGTHSGKTTKCL